MATKIARLRCEYLENPLGIDEKQPRLSWIMLADRRGARQSAWRLRVASSRERLEQGDADLWDSGQVESDQSIHVVYAGARLQSGMECYWQVTVWDETGSASTSPTAHFTMGLLEPGDWHAQWIAHDPEIIRRDPQAIEPTDVQGGTVPMFRKAFHLPTGIRRATLYATARGLLDLRLGGRDVTPDRFVPEWTDYHQRLHYRTFDVTDLLVPGENVMAAMLGDGWWSGYVGWQERRGQYGTLRNSLLVQLEVELADGTSVRVCSDSSWRCDVGPILGADFMMGETYDARRERSGWDQPGFDDSSWLSAMEVAPPTKQTPHYAFSNNRAAVDDEPLMLGAQRAEPVRVVETISPVSVKKAAPGVFIYDLGQNFAGWVRLSVRGPAGTRIQLRHAERLNPDGTLYTENLRRARATDAYILRGDGDEVWQPRFTFHGFQYVELTGLAAPLPLDKLCGCVVMSSTRPTGQFECSHPLVNRLWQNAMWSQKGNFLSVPTDCPQRDERLGWMGDAQVFLRTAAYNMDVAAFFTKWMTDVTDSQDVDGVFPDVAPRLAEGERFVGLDGLGGGAGWADAGIIVPWTMWQVYGDLRIAERHWPAMVRWCDWLEATNPDGIRSRALNNNYGDWLCIPSDTSFRTQSPMKTLLATAYWADDAAKMAQLARALGKAEDAARFDAMHARVRDAFQAQWLLDDGRLAVDTQTAYLLALAFDLLPEEVRSRAAEHLVDNIRRHDWHLSTGFIGIRLLNPILTEFGHADVAFRLLCNEDYPSWLYPIRHGATTIWERWNGWTEEDGFFNPQMNSFNHYSLGSVSEWLYRYVAGIELDPTEPGFKHFVVRPAIDTALSHASARYESMHGTISSRWQREADHLRLDVSIPANTRARIYLPCGAADEVWEGGRLAGKAPGVRELERGERTAVYLAEAGSYAFVVHNTPTPK